MSTLLPNTKAIETEARKAYHDARRAALQRKDKRVGTQAYAAYRAVLVAHGVVEPIDKEIAR